MDTQLVVAILLAVGFAVTNGLHDASNAIATLVATRAARPSQAIVLASVFNVLGPLFLGAGVADTIGGIVTVAAGSLIQVVGAGLVAAVTWNLVTWRLGLPSSSGHALVGGLVGPAVFEGGLSAVAWGGMEHWRPVGVFGILAALAASPVLGGLAAVCLIRVARTAGQRATRRWQRPVRVGEWAMSAALAFSHGANDAQKSIGVVAALLLAADRVDSLTAPWWATACCAAALTAGTAIGGWRIIATVGRGIYRIRPEEGLLSQTASAGVIFGASLLGAPVSTTQVVASSVVGIGLGRLRWHHVHWAVVRSMGVAWLITMPASATLGVIVLQLWRIAS